MIPCDYEGCNEQATYGVFLQAYVKDIPKNDRPRVSIASRCILHKEVKWADLVDESTWQRVTQIVVNQGHIAPSRALSNVIIIPFEQ